MERFEKQVEIKAVNDEERVATGVVLTPWEVDRQGDWLRPEGIEAMYTPSPDDGVMHAAFPDDDAELIRNEVLTESEEIDGVEFDEGEWVIRRKYHNDELWSLVGNILHGFSIGGEVSEVNQWDDPAELPDEVTFPDGVEEGETTELVNGFVEEISDVDIPAVPQATYATVKSLGKSVLDDVSSKDEFVEVMEERGHKAKDAEALWSYIQERKEAGIDVVDQLPDEIPENTKMDDESEPAVEDLEDEDIGFLKQLRNLVTKSDDDVKQDDPPEISSAEVSKAIGVAKAGRTLSDENVRALMAAHDAIEASLATELDFRQNRFTDDPNSDFDIADFDKSADEESLEKALEKLTDAQVVHVTEAIEEFVDSQGGDAEVSTLREWTWNKEDDLDGDVLTALNVALDEFWDDQHPENQAVAGRFAEWVEEQADTISIANMADNDELVSKLDELTDTVESIDERVKDLESEGDDPSDDEGDDGTEKGVTGEDVLEGLNTLNEKVEDIEERVDEMSKASADTQQAESTESGDNENSEKDKFLRDLVGGAN